jgi:GTPase
VVDISHPKYEEQMQVVNKTLQDLKCHDKPVITVFNKMDMYEKNHFDEWLDEEVKQTILQELKERWENETQGNCIFVSAVEKRNIAELRTSILNQVKQLYRIRYPYKTEYLY